MYAFVMVIAILRIVHEDQAACGWIRNVVDGRTEHQVAKKRVYKRVGTRGIGCRGSWMIPQTQG